MTELLVLAICAAVPWLIALAVIAVPRERHAHRRLLLRRGSQALAAQRAAAPQIRPPRIASTRG
jgi:hypothetical protein